MAVIRHLELWRSNNEFIEKSKHFRAVVSVDDLQKVLYGLLKRPYKTFCRSSTETTALKCLVFEKIAFLCTHFGDRQTNRRTDEQH